MGPSRTGVGMVHSNSSSGIFFQGDMQSQSLNNPHLTSFGNSTNSISNNIRSNMVGDITNTVMNSIATSGPSIGASSLVTDANSGLSGGGNGGGGGGGPRIQRSASANTESYMRLPASPLSFSSNNISISGSSIIDQTSNQDQHPQQMGPRQGASSATSLPPPRIGQVASDNNISHLQKKPRLDIKQEDMMQQQVLQQMLQRQDLQNLQNPDPQLQTLIQQQRIRQQQQQQQQQLLQSLPPVQRAHLLQQQQQQQQQLQLRQQLQQQQSMQQVPSSGVKRPYDGGVCSRRLMQYLYHQRQRPAENVISYWRKFVAEYYSPRAKKRWCLSLYDNVGHHSLGVFPQAAMDAWQCDICGSKSGRGFEATFEVLPRLNEIKFGSGVIDELLFLDLPREYRFPSGIMVLEYGQAVQESIYEQLRVVREGQLKVIFTPDLKILTWEFCARRHEELLPRRLVAPQVNQLLQVAQKCQSTIAESGSDGVSQQDLQTNSNMVVTAGRQLARSLELQSLNDLGFSKRYVRCLQISEVVNSMKDLIDFCRETKAGPIEGLKNYPRLTSSTKSQMEQISTIPGLPADRTTLGKLVSLHPGLNNPLTNSQQQHMNPRAPLTATSSHSQAALALSNFQNMLMRQNSINSNPQQEASSSYPFQTGLLNPHMIQQQRPVGVFNQQLSSPSHSGSQSQSQSQTQIQQQHMIQQLLHDMSSSGNGGGNGGGARPSHSGQSAASGGRYGGGTTSPRPPAVPTRSNSFKGVSRSDSSAGVGVGVTVGVGVGDRDRKGELGNLCCDDIVGDIGSEFNGSGFFDNDEMDDGMGYGWKG